MYDCKFLNIYILVIFRIVATIRLSQMVTNTLAHNERPVDFIKDCMLRPKWSIQWNVFSNHTARYHQRVGCLFYLYGPTTNRLTTATRECRIWGTGGWCCVCCSCSTPDTGRSCRTLYTASAVRLGRTTCIHRTLSTCDVLLEKKSIARHVLTPAISPT